MRFIRRVVGNNDIPLGQRCERIARQTTVVVRRDVADEIAHLHRMKEQTSGVYPREENAVKSFLGYYPPVNRRHALDQEIFRWLDGQHLAARRRQSVR